MMEADEPLERRNAIQQPHSPLIQVNEIPKQSKPKIGSNLNYIHYANTRVEVIILLQLPAKKQLWVRGRSIGSLEKMGPEKLMGRKVSDPQDLRSKTIQRKAIRMDKMIRALLEKYTLAELSGNPHWEKLIELYQTMEEFLPEGYSSIMDHVDLIPNAIV